VACREGLCGHNAVAACGDVAQPGKRSEWLRGVALGSIARSAHGFRLLIYLCLVIIVTTSPLPGSNGQGKRRTQLSSVATNGVRCLQVAGLRHAYPVGWSHDME
jgi:hypothetical protein